MRRTGNGRRNSQEEMREGLDRYWATSMGVVLVGLRERGNGNKTKPFLENASLKSMHSDEPKSRQVTWKDFGCSASITQEKDSSL